MNKQELDKVLQEHKEWFDSDGTRGKRANLEGAYLRKANLWGAELGGADLRKAYLGRANLSGAYLGRANLRGAYLGGANLWGANLRGADLTGAELTGANLEGADLRGANLRRADFERAYLAHTDIFAFYAGKHFGFYHISKAYPEGNYLRIGCEGHSLATWLERGKKIGKAAEYQQHEIDLYMHIIREVVTRIELRSK